MAKKKRVAKKRFVPELKSYLLEIDNWDVSYSFGSGRPNLDQGHYSEHCELSIEAKLTQPPDLRGKPIKMMLLGNREEDAILDKPEDYSFQPRNIGALTIRGEQREYLGVLPLSVLWGLLPAFGAMKLRWISLVGEKLKRGKAAIRSIGFSDSYEPGDYE